MVHFDQVSLAVDRNVILRNISMHIKPGEFVYVLGQSGAGKSTLLRSLYADLLPSEGNLRVLDREINGIKFKDIPFLRREMGIIFQDFKLLSDRDIYHNLKFVLEAIGWTSQELIHQRIIEVLYIVGLKDLRNRFPHELSGGEQQRVGVARAILNSPKLLIADEPTGNLDPKTARNIFKLIYDQYESNHATVLFSTHAYDLIEDFPGKIMYVEKRGIQFLNYEQFKSKIQQLKLEEF